MNNLVSPTENFNTKAGPFSHMLSHPFLRSSVVPAICPKCHAPALHRSHTMTSADQFRRNFTTKKKYRCHVCNWEGWLDEARLTYPSVSLVGSVPTVSGEDVDIPSIMLNDGHSSSQSEQPGTFPESGSAGSIQAPKQKAQPEQHAEAASGRQYAPHAGERAMAAANGKSSAPVRPAPADAQPADDQNHIESVNAEMPANEAEPFSTKVNAGFHHHSRHKAVACPACSEYTLFRSRSRGMGEMLRKKFTNKRPYRCHKCGWRGWVIKGL